MRFSVSDRFTCGLSSRMTFPTMASIDAGTSKPACGSRVAVTTTVSCWAAAPKATNSRGQPRAFMASGQRCEVRAHRGDVQLGERLRRFGHEAIEVGPGLRLVALQLPDEVVVMLRCEPRDVLLA